MDARTDGARIAHSLVPYHSAPTTTHHSIRPLSLRLLAAAYSHRRTGMTRWASRSGSRCAPRARSRSPRAPDAQADYCTEAGLTVRCCTMESAPTRPVPRGTAHCNALLCTTAHSAVSAVQHLTAHHTAHLTAHIPRQSSLQRTTTPFPHSTLLHPFPSHPSHPIPIQPSHPDPSPIASK